MWEESRNEEIIYGEREEGYNMCKRGIQSSFDAVMQLTSRIVICNNIFLLRGELCVSALLCITDNTSLDQLK